MARKEDLRNQRTDTVINLRSQTQEQHLVPALRYVEDEIIHHFRVNLDFQKTWHLKDIVQNLKTHFSNIDFHHHFNNTSMRPDGGILSLQRNDGKRYPILITEVKNQGTNDIRASEGKKKQAKGNAIERLGKNVIGFRTAMITEGIFPFICFGDGCDFEDGSSILDRVTTIAMFGRLNQINLHVDGLPHARFDRGSFFFRPEPWTAEEMRVPMLEIAKGAVYYYFSKYGDNCFSG
ncbi:MAG: hypothetical protein OXH65_01270 [Paracoccaceae bacterium]|nr:hypothetical protein [Paracoccaceae bacterium]